DQRRRPRHRRRRWRGAVSDEGLNPRRLVFDTMVLSAFAKSDRLDVLGSLLAGDTCYVTDIVRDEIRRGVPEHPRLSAVEDAEWLENGVLTSDAELINFLQWTERIGSTNRDLGEASVFAFADVHGATAMTDDRPATRVARTHGLDAHGSLW